MSGLSSEVAPDTLATETDIVTIGCATRRRGARADWRAGGRRFGWRSYEHLATSWSTRKSICRSTVESGIARLRGGRLAGIDFLAAGSTVCDSRNIDIIDRRCRLIAAVPSSPVRSSSGWRGPVPRPVCHASHAVRRFPPVIAAAVALVTRAPREARDLFVDGEHVCPRFDAPRRLARGRAARERVRRRAARARTRRVTAPPRSARIVVAPTPRHRSARARRGGYSVGDGRPR